MRHGLSKFETLLVEASDAPKVVLPDTFGYLLKRNPLTGNLKRRAIVEAYEKLVDGMSSSDTVEGPADAGMTFLGQFIDHDITLDATSELGTLIDPRSIRNLRTPNLDLDCVYGDGPEASPYLYSHEEKTKNFLIFGRKDSPLDLQRNSYGPDSHGRALIGDPRNDENIIVSQIQGAFICLHNILMSHAKAGQGVEHDIESCALMNVRSKAWEDFVPDHKKLFEEVRRFIRLHYQWIILNDFLPSFVDPAVIRKVANHDPFGAHAPIMPVEFSVAAYRFGHATVQPTYCLRDGTSPVQLFKMEGFKPRGTEQDIEMGQFFSHGGGKAQKARPVGPSMADILFTLPDNVANDMPEWGGVKLTKAQGKKLGLRNILRDRATLEVPSGQQMARHLGIKELAAPPALKEAHIDKTPLWFYCLQEAGEMGHGKLTGVGGTIVASVIMRILRFDPDSVLHVPDFKPWAGFGGENCTFASMVHFVEEHRDAIPERKDLYYK
ncbi:peroxidase family protein [Fulvimarina sp. MAC8]|uniref:peroxidase family protein n=1 Tax=Fulvimarina sp. MAC8 TaxID=3162874 RepID=UPI0032EDE9D6